MVYCDKNDKILEWGRKRLNYPIVLLLIIEFIDISDFHQSSRDTGRIKTYLMISPLKQTEKPKPKRQTKNYLREVYEYLKNQAKWKA